MVPGRAGRRARQPRARPLPLPRRPGAGRRRPTTGSPSSAARPGRRSTDGQWYLHLFDSTQPDLDWRNPEVADDVRGRPALLARPRRRRLPRRRGPRALQGGGPARPGPRGGRAGLVRPGQHRPLDGVPRAQATSRCGTSPRCTTSTAPGTASSTRPAPTGWPSPRPGPRRPSRPLAYVRPDELHQAFNFAWLLADWSAEAFAEVITSTLDGRRAGRRLADLGAQQPRRRTPRHPLRRRRAGPGPRPAPRR